MRPVLFRWHGWTVWSYPAMLYVGSVCGILFGTARADEAGLDAFRVWIALFVLLGIALLGARALFVATEWSTFRNNLRRIWERQTGGASQYGGLLAAVPASWPLLGALNVPFGAFWDIGAIAILVAMMFTRVGCLLNGCCAGRPVRFFGVNLPNHRGVWRRRVPTQLLECGFAAVLLTLALVAGPRMPFDGALFLLAAGGYATGRLVLESARERVDRVGPFTTQHAISLVIMAIAFTGLAVLWPR
jgi:phosphatidylglycerol---prolipoprotein diacylglyceryl transferase